MRDGYWRAKPQRSVENDEERWGDKGNTYLSRCREKIVKITIRTLSNPSQTRLNQAPRKNIHTL